MTQLTQGRLTPRRNGDQVGHDVAANTILFTGGLVALNATGFAVPATKAGRNAVGVNECDVDNSKGADGDLQASVRRDCFAFDNSPTSACTRVDIGAVAYVEDDSTVARTGTAIAGVIVDITDEGVWVDVGRYPITVEAA
ncbi:hypothetical protein L2Y94_06610 [Luteibacter aegosomatis]|uniref:hypothetical protein n=1 Tax=Luteibacter aegosomatis TaxID=2911537 RepID=UPI001FF89966|nr:hypothetical protein [Luteibacter aegosomatis]UPG87023.1 hypothetical protein L2Y94_06610 [Luteibacter aegosomatis]